MLFRDTVGVSKGYHRIKKMYGFSLKYFYGGFIGSAFYILIHGRQDYDRILTAALRMEAKRRRASCQVFMKKRYTGHYFRI